MVLRTSHSQSRFGYSHGRAMACILAWMSLASVVHPRPQQQVQQVQQVHSWCAGGSTASGSSCDIASGLAHLTSLRSALAQRVSLLLRARAMESITPPSRRLTVAASLTDAAVAVGELFELAIARDAALATDAVEAMLRYQLVSRGASPHGWADGTASLQELAARLPYDELEGAISVLRDAADAADAILGALPPPSSSLGIDEDRTAAASSQPASALGFGGADVRGPSVEVSADGYLRRRGTAPDPNAPPIFVAGFNSAANLMQRGRDSDGGRYQLDPKSARRLRALGTNTIVLFASPAVLLGPNATRLAHAPLQKLQDELRSAASEGLGVILHVPSTMPRWALELHPGLGVSEGQHSIDYDIDHPAAAGLMAAFFRVLLPHLTERAPSAPSAPSSPSTPAPAPPAPRACHPAILGLQLANEPALRGTSSVHTRASFATWLRGEYNSSLAELRANWGEGEGGDDGEAAGPAVAALTSFEAAAALGAPPPPGAGHRAIAEPPPGSGMAARVSDWFRFNDFRFARWQLRLATAIWRASPCYATLAKLNQAFTIDERLADNGVDAASMVAGHNISAYDSGFGFGGPGSTQDGFKTPPSAFYSTSSYSSDWLNQLGEKRV